MGMVVRSNVMAANANRQLGMNNSSVSKNLEKLSSGFKINRAGDDASGLAISEKMKAQIKGLETASANSQDGISLVQTAEGALTEVHSMLNRMTELATKSANGTIKDDVDREAIQKEVDALNSEIDRISQSTNFNGINLLDGSMGGGQTGGTVTTAGGASNTTVENVKMTLTGAPAGGSVDLITHATAEAVTYNATTGAMTLQLKVDTKYTQKDIDTLIAGAAGVPKGFKLTVDKDFTTGDTAVATGTATNKVTAAAAKFQEYSGAVNGQKVKLTSNKAGVPKMTFADVANTGTAASVSVVAATGVVTMTLVTAGTYSASDVNKMLKGAGVDYTMDFKGTLTGAQIGDALGAATTTGAGLAGNGLELQVGDTADSFNQVSVSVDDMSSKGIGTEGLDVSTQTAAKSSQATIKDAINKVSTNRANLGALQNRLEYTINNLDVSAENMTAANSRIRDTDMAKQMMDYTKMNVLTQAAQAMLAQANQQPQSILQLLQ